MILGLINRTRIRSWQYSISKEKGYCLGFYWKLLLFNPFRKIHYYELSRPKEKGAIFIELSATDKQSAKDLIEDHICMDYDNLLVQWIVQNYKKNPHI